MKLRGLEEWCLLLGLIICLDSVTFGWCTKPIVDFEISPSCYDESDDKYYVGYEEEINIDAYNPYNPYTLLSADPDCRECEQCDGISCSGEELLNGLQKFKWYFGDGTTEWETCSSQDDGDFDGETTHEYTSTGNKTVAVIVYDGDETCDYGCPDGWGDQYNIKSKSIVVVRVDLDFGGFPDSIEESDGGFLAYNDDDDDNDEIVDRLDSTVTGGDCDITALSFSISPSLSEGEVKLDVTAGSSKIKLWEDTTKGTEVSLPETWDLSIESLPSHYYVEGYDTSGSLKDIEIVLSYSREGCGTIHSDKIKITVIDVDYTEDSSQTYGYDKYTDTQSDTPSFFPYKSVKVGGSDTVYADISGGSSMAGQVYFTSSNTSNVTVSPTQASSTHQQVTFSGVSEGFAQGLAELYDPVLYDIVAASIGVYAYNQDSYTVAVRVIHEDDDDVQNIPVGCGKANQVCITKGANNVLETMGYGDDLTFPFSLIDTGPDGICDTTANNLIPSGDDVQVIPVGQGQPYWLCVSAGTNTERDTNPSGDDGISGPTIHTGSDGVCDTTADNTDDLSTDPYTAAELQTYLNDTIYNQAVVDWDVTKVSAKDWNFDLNRDGQLDVSTSGWTAEQLEIINNCDPPGTYHQVVFIVNNPDESWCGCCVSGQKYSFVFPDNSPDEKKTTAHEWVMESLVCLI